MKKSETNRILQEVEAGYNQMASKFSETRKFFWRDLEFIKDYARGKVLDYGSGNGRLLELIKEKNIEYYGLDISEELIAQAKEKYPEAHFQKLNVQEASLPFPGEFFNTIYSIAVFHHLPSREYREEIAEKLYRMANRNSCIIITVWNLWQQKYRKNIFKNWINKLTGKSNLDWNDCYISFKNNQGEVFYRYHHAFTERELRKLFEKAGFKTIKCEVVGGRNIIYHGKK